MFITNAEMCIIWAEMSPLHLSDLVLEWCDLDQGVAMLSQVLSFLAEIIVPLLADVLFLAEIITRQSAHAILLVKHTLS